MPFQHDRIGAETIDQFSKGNLCGKPARILGDVVHGFGSVVPNEVQAFANRHERFETGAPAGMSELKVARFVCSGQQPGKQRASVGEELLLEICPSGPGVIEYLQPAFIERNDSPFIEYHILIARVHLVSAALDFVLRLVKIHTFVTNEAGFWPSASVCT